jgi:ABC-type molybdate transport system substrate-binding protein
MGQLKRSSTTITAVERGAIDVNYVYRGSTLIWQKSSPSISQTIKIFQTLLQPQEKELEYETTLTANYKNQI